MAAHRLAVGVELRLLVLHERSIGDEPVEGLPSLGVSLRRGAVRPVGEVYLRAGDVKEALRVSGRKGLGLGSVNHIIRNGRDLRRVLHVRPYGRKSAYEHLAFLRNRC